MTVSGFQIMMAKSGQTVSLGAGIGSEVQITLPTVCADDFAKVPPPAGDWVPGELFIEMPGAPDESPPGLMEKKLDQAIELLKQPWGGRVREDAEELYYGLRPLPSPYLPIIDTVSSMAPELASRARAIGMPVQMFQDGVAQYSIWQKVGEGTDRPFTRQSIRDVLFHTLRAAGREASEEKVEEASHAFWVGVESVTAKLTTVPAGPRSGLSSVGEGTAGVTVEPGKTTAVSVPVHIGPRQEAGILPPANAPDATAPEKRAIVEVEPLDGTDTVAGAAIFFPDGTRVVNHGRGHEVVYDPQGNVVGGHPQPWQPPLDDPQWLEFVEMVAEQARQRVEYYETNAAYHRNAAEEARDRGDEEEARLQEAEARGSEAEAEAARVRADREQRRADAVRQHQRTF